MKLPYAKYSHRAWFRVLANARLWIWCAILLSVLICAMVSWLHLEQRKVLRLALGELANIRQARVDLSRGFLHLSLAGDFSTPFNQTQGLALIQQATDAFERVLAGLSVEDPEATTAFRERAAGFGRRLAEW